MTPAKQLSRCEPLKKRLSKQPDRFNSSNRSPIRAVDEIGKKINSVLAAWTQSLIHGGVLGHLREQAVLAAHARQDLCPQFFRLSFEDQFERSGMRQPGIPFHLLLQLARTPS